MKRTLTLVLTVAMVGSLMFMGFAGTAAAQDGGLIDIGADNDVDQDSDSNSEVNVAQSNSNSQSQTTVAYSSSDESYATANAEQGQDVTQANSAEVGDTTSIAANNAEVDSGIGFDISVDLGDLLNGDDDGTNGDETDG